MARRTNIGDPVQEYLEVTQVPALTTADRVSTGIGTGTFILTQLAVILAWVALNVLLPVGLRWDPSPFLMLTLVLSVQAAFTAPIIIMSQNRQESRDRLVANNDYRASLRVEAEVKVLLNLVRHQQEQLDNISKHLLDD